MKRERSTTPADILVNIKSLLQLIPVAELGIKCPLVYSISSGVGDLSRFTTSFQ